MDEVVLVYQAASQQNCRFRGYRTCALKVEDLNLEYFPLLCLTCTQDFVISILSLLVVRVGILYAIVRRIRGLYVQVVVGKESTSPRIKLLRRTGLTDVELTYDSSSSLLHQNWLVNLEFMHLQSFPQTCRPFSRSLKLRKAAGSNWAASSTQVGQGFDSNGSNMRQGILSLTETLEIQDYRL
jgi:hypothetical protein